jgi:hypothetical protein
MKTILSLLVCGLLIFAQVSGAAPAFGVKAGLNLANMTFDPSEGTSTSIRTGIGIGGDVEFSLTPTNKITLRTDVMYMMKGAKDKGTLLGYDYTATYKVDEIVVAPFLVFRFPSGGATPFLQVGPELGLNVTKKVSVEAAGVTASGDISDWSGTNFGLNLGGGVAVPTGKAEVVFDARYNLGLTNMYTGSGGGTIKTNGIQFLVGYNFSVPAK